LLCSPETVLGAGFGNGQPKPVPGILAVVALDDEAHTIEGGAGQRRFNIAFDEFATRLLKTAVRMRQETLKHGRFVSGYKCSVKSADLPRLNIVLELREISSPNGVRGHAIDVSQGCVPALCSVWAGAISLSGDRRCSAVYRRFARRSTRSQNRRSRSRVSRRGAWE